MSERITPPATLKIHKNSNDYIGPTHVYTIERNGVPYKVGESADGTRVQDGASIRAERQARALRKETGDRFKTTIIAETNGKFQARQFETYLIQNYRDIYGADTLPGNKGVR